MRSTMVLAFETAADVSVQGVGIIGWFTLTDRPATAKWLSAEEKALAEYRIKSENVATRVVLDKVKGKAIWQGAASFNTLVVGLVSQPGIAPMSVRD